MSSSLGGDTGIPGLSTQNEPQPEQQQQEEANKPATAAESQPQSQSHGPPRDPTPAQPPQQPPSDTASQPRPASSSGPSQPSLPPLLPSMSPGAAASSEPRPSSGNMSISSLLSAQLNHRPNPSSASSSSESPSINSNALANGYHQPPQQPQNSDPYAWTPRGLNQNNNNSNTNASHQRPTSTAMSLPPMYQQAPVQPRQPSSSSSSSHAQGNAGQIRPPGLNRGPSQGYWNRPSSHGSLYSGGGRYPPSSSAAHTPGSASSASSPKQQQQQHQGSAPADHQQHQQSGRPATHDGSARAPSSGSASASLPPLVPGSAPSMQPPSEYAQHFGGAQQQHRKDSGSHAQQQQQQQRRPEFPGHQRSASSGHHHHHHQMFAPPPQQPQSQSQPHQHHHHHRKPSGGSPNQVAHAPSTSRSPVEQQPHPLMYGWRTQPPHSQQHQHQHHPPSHHQQHQQQQQQQSSPRDMSQRPSSSGGKSTQQPPISSQYPPFYSVSYNADGELNTLPRSMGQSQPQPQSRPQQQQQQQQRQQQQQPQQRDAPKPTEKPVQGSQQPPPVVSSAAAAAASSAPASVPTPAPASAPAPAIAPPSTVPSTTSAAAAPAAAAAVPPQAQPQSQPPQQQQSAPAAPAPTSAPAPAPAPQAQAPPPPPPPQPNVTPNALLQAIFSPNVIDVHSPQLATQTPLEKLKCLGRCFWDPTSGEPVLPSTVSPDGHLDVLVDPRWFQGVRWQVVQSPTEPVSFNNQASTTDDSESSPRKKQKVDDDKKEEEDLRSWSFYDLDPVRKRSLWGTDVYTDDSDPVLAAIHTGWLRLDDFASAQTKKNETGGSMLSVRVRTHRKLINFQGSARAGVRSRSWGNSHDGISFSVDSVKLVDDLPKTKKAARKTAQRRMARERALNPLGSVDDGRKAAPPLSTLDLCKTACKWTPDGHLTMPYSPDAAIAILSWMKNTIPHLCLVARAGSTGGEAHFWASANAPDSFGCRQILPSGNDRKMSVPWPAQFDLSRIFAPEPNARGGSLDRQQHDKPKQAAAGNEWSDWTSSVRFTDLTVVQRTPPSEELAGQDQ